MACSASEAAHSPTRCTSVNLKTLARLALRGFLRVHAFCFDGSEHCEGRHCHHKLTHYCLPFSFLGVKRTRLASI
jgi:hypothetical protein